jgi:tripartite-type tricarboxylate transporter receptor subunit TctC
MLSRHKGLSRQIAIIMVVLPALLLGFLPSSLRAQNAAAFYKGKVVNFVVGFSPGGGVDVSSRLIANPMGKLANCTFVVRNMPGAGGILGLNHVYTADPDGLTVMIAPLGLTEVAQLLKSPGMKYDCRRFNWLGRFNTEPQVLITGVNSPFKSLDDLRKAKTVFSTGAEPTARASLAILITAEALGLDNVKVIYGYPGSAEQILALIRGEADLYSPSLGTYLRQKKELRPLLVIDRKRVSDIPDVPALGEMSIKKESKDLVEAFLSIWEIGLSVITSPGVPADRVKFLREIFAKSMQDKELIARADKLDISLNPLPGEQVEKLVKSAMGLSQEDLKKLDNIISVKYKK